MFRVSLGGTIICTSLKDHRNAKKNLFYIHKAISFSADIFEEKIFVRLISIFAVYNINMYLKKLNKQKT